MELEKFTLPADTVAPTGATVAVTVDASNDTEAERITQANHTMTVTLDVPEWLPAGSAFGLLIAFDCAAHECSHSVRRAH